MLFVLTFLTMTFEVSYSQHFTVGHKVLTLGWHLVLLSNRILEGSNLFERFAY